MAIRHKKSLADIKQNLLDKRREDYGKGLTNLLITVGGQQINIGDKNLWKDVESNTRKSRAKWYEWIFSKTSRVGRFGQKSVKNKKLNKMADEMEKSGGLGGYFDPMQEMSIDGSGNTKDTIGEEFYNLVTDEANLAQKNDFHSQLTEGGRGYSVLSHAYQNKKMNDEELEATYVSEYEKRHDGTKMFVPDPATQVLDGEPDNFAVSVGVVGATRFYTEHTKESAKQKGWDMILKTLKGNKEEEEEKEDNGEKEEKEDKIAQAVMEKTPLYKKLVEEGKRRNKKYNPKTDPLVENLKEEIKNEGRNGSAGHAFVRLIPKIGTKKKASYSFGLYTMGPGKIGGVDEGYVENPEPQADQGGVTEKEYKVPFSGYLNAAAKIRGIIASGRKYSVTGYNCTSFAIEVAKSAGVSISDKEVAVDMTTFDSRLERLDMPSSLQNFLFKEKLKAGEMENDPKMELSPDKESYYRVQNTEEKTQQDDDQAVIEHQQRKENEWTKLIAKLPFFEKIYENVNDEGLYKKIIQNMMECINEKKISFLDDYLKEKGIEVDPNDKLHPGFAIMDNVCINQEVLFDILEWGVELPHRSPDNYMVRLRRQMWDNGNYSYYSELLKKNQYFINSGLGELTDEQAEKVLKKILEHEMYKLDMLAKDNDINFGYDYRNPDKIYESAEKGITWQGILKKEYGMENVLEYLTMVFESLEGMRQYMEERSELLWSIQDYLAGINE